MADEAKPDTSSTSDVAAKATGDPTAGTPAPDLVVTDEITTKLLELGVDDLNVIGRLKNLGVSTVDDLVLLKEVDLIEAGVSVIQARKLVVAFTPVPVTADTTTLNAAAFDSILPLVPSDESWLEALKTGGVLKVDQSTVIAAIRAALADRVGLFDIPSKLVAAMEAYADENDEQVDNSFFALRKQITQRSYADVFAAIDGLDGKFVTDGRKRQLFERVNAYLWPSIISFYGQLQSWQEAWMQGASNPALMMAAMMGTGNGVGMPPGMLAPPETGALRDYADAVSDAVNRVFAGTGRHVASALAYDASQVKKTMEDPRLPSLIGAANRDQMLKKLGVSVNATYPRLESNLTRFVLSTLQAKDVPAGNEEYQYFGTLYMLGSQIPWDQLDTSRGGYSGVAGRTSDRL